MKIIAKVILALIFCASFVCLFAEADNPSSQVAWTLCSAAACCLSGHFLFKLANDEYKNEEI